MTKTTMAVLSLLLVAPAAFGENVSIGWSGDIVDYASTPGSGAPLVLDNEDLQGYVTFNTSLLPGPDSGVSPPLLSFSGSDLFHSTIQWDGGTFRSGFSHTGVDSENILFNTVTDELTLSDDNTWTDSGGNTHDAQFTLDLTGYGKNASGSGSFLNVSSDAGYAADFQVEHVHVKTVGAPEIDPGSALSALTLLAGCLTVIRGRRRPA